MALREKKQKHCQGHETAVVGDMWEHTAVAADSKLVVSLVVGKRTAAQTLSFVTDTKHRLRPGHLLAMFTEAYTGYASALLEVLGRRSPQPRPSATGRASRLVVRWPQGLGSGPVHKISKGSRVERVAVRAVHGKARLTHALALLGDTHMNPSVVERHNGTSRLRNQWKVRKTLAFSNVPRYHRWMRWLSVGLYNFWHAHGSVKIKQEAQVSHRSPAMAAT